MSSFSIRNNLDMKIFQKNSINRELRTSLWNCIYEKFEDELIHNSVHGDLHWSSGMYDLGSVDN